VEYPLQKPGIFYEFLIRNSHFSTFISLRVSTLKKGTKKMIFF